MDLRKTLIETSAILNAQGIDHALIGGLAMAVHGVNRATADVDFLADGSRVKDIREAMTGGGFTERFSSPEVLQFAGVGFVDILLANRPLSLAMLKEAKEEPLLKVRVLSAEHLIGLKIQAYANDPLRKLQDQADIQSLILKHPHLDFAKIKIYADLFGEWPTIERIRGSK